MVQEDKLPDWAVGNAGEGMNVVMAGATVSTTLVTVMITLALGSVGGLAGDLAPMLELNIVASLAPTQ